MTNPDGVDFSAYLELSQMVLLEKPEVQFEQIMDMVKNGILSGAQIALKDLPLEDKYQGVAFNALMREM
jgi:hypothetical protein